MKNTICCVLFLGIFVLNNACVNAQKNYEKVSVDSFSNEIKKNHEIILVDVRTPEEFSKGHLQNAILMNFNDPKFDQMVNELDKSKEILVYCLSGGRSAKASQIMLDKGLKVKELDGGIMKWRGANMPETKANINTGMSLAQYLEFTASSPKVLIDFYADWCGPCKVMKPFLDKISLDMAADVKVIRINADDNQALCKELKIDALPVLQVYKNNKLTWSNVGFANEKTVVSNLK